MEKRGGISIPRFAAALKSVTLGRCRFLDDLCVDSLSIRLRMCSSFGNLFGEHKYFISVPRLITALAGERETLTGEKVILILLRTLGRSVRLCLVFLNCRELD